MKNSKKKRDRKQGTKMAKREARFIRRANLTEKIILQENVVKAEDMKELKELKEKKERQGKAVLLERASTAAACLNRFFTTIKGLQQIHAEKEEQKLKGEVDVVIKPMFVTISGVGLRLEGRSGRYHLYWFPLTDKIFAVDEANKDLVWEMAES